MLSQAVSYPSWLDSAHHEAGSLVLKVLGAVAAESIGWRRIASRYGRTTDSYLDGLHLRASTMWTKDLTRTTR